MNIQTVAQNLRNTIAGKQAMLDGLRVSNKEGYYIIKQWLEINIDELSKILADVEKCQPPENPTCTVQDWITSPDRMGGQYTEDEINRGSEWR